MEKIVESINNINVAVSKLNSKQSKVIFLSPDTKGNAKASVSYIYRMARVLKDNGVDVNILHEKNDYINPTSWLSFDVSDIEHKSIENNDLKVGPQDFIFVPEIYANVFEQIQQLPVEKVILVQNYEYLLDWFTPGKSWLDYDVTECVTTSNVLKDAIRELIPVGEINFVNPCVPNIFKPQTEPNKLVVAIHSKDQRKSAKIIKSFYLKYPLYRFISFKDMHGMTELDMANNLSECAVSVWLDPDSSFGTFPVESMMCNVPVIGKIPTIVPEWMNDDNGVWVYDENQIPDLIFNYIKNWMEDTIPENLTNMNIDNLSAYNEVNFTKASLELFNDLISRKVNKLNRIKETLEKTLNDNE
jgi:glycosyltransferase involved in cell wall biosynthesis